MSITITMLENGPYLISGDDAARVTVLGADGAPTPTGTSIALCRCGASSTKPFCDGTHATIGFRGGERTGRPGADATA